MLKIMSIMGIVGVLFFTTTTLFSFNTTDEMVAYLCKVKNVPKDSCNYAYSKYYTGSHMLVKVWDSANEKCYQGKFYNDGKVEIEHVTWDKSEEMCEDY